MFKPPKRKQSSHSLCLEGTPNFGHFCTAGSADLNGIATSRLHRSVWSLHAMAHPKQTMQLTAVGFKSTACLHDFSCPASVIIFDPYCFTFIPNSYMSNHVHTMSYFAASSLSAHPFCLAHFSSTSRAMGDVDLENPLIQRALLRYPDVDASTSAPGDDGDGDGSGALFMKRFDPL